MIHLSATTFRANLLVSIRIRSILSHPISPNSSPYSLVILSVPLASHLSIQLKAATVNLGLHHEMDGDFLFPHLVQSLFISRGHEDAAWKDPLNFTESVP